MKKNDILIKQISLLVRGYATAELLKEEMASLKAEQKNIPKEKVLEDWNKRINTMIMDYKHL